VVVRKFQGGDGGTDVQSYDLKDISDDIRRRIVSWQNKLEDNSKVKELKEFTHYNVIVKLDSTETPSVTIYCELCNKPYKLARRKTKNTILMSNWTGHIKECVELKYQKGATDTEENPQTIMKQQTLSGFIKSQKCVYHQAIQSQSDSKSNVNHQPSNASISSKIFSKEMRPLIPVSGDTADCHVSPTTSSGNLAIDSNGEVSESESFSTNEVQDFCDAPSGEVVQEGQFKPPKVYVNKSYTARKNKKRLEYDPMQLRLTDYLPITDTQVKDAVTVLKGLQPIEQSIEGQFSTSFFQQLLQNAYNNCSHLPHSRRHSEVEKSFLYHFCYELAQQDINYCTRTCQKHYLLCQQYNEKLLSNLIH